MNRTKAIACMLGGLMTASLLVVGSAYARRVPGWAGVPFPGSEANCWTMTSGVLQLNTAACGAGTGSHFYEIPLEIDSATTIDPTWVHTQTGFGLGTICGRTMTYDATGALSAAQSSACGAGTHNHATLTVPTNGTAVLEVLMSADTGTNHMDFGVSYVSWTP